MPKSESHQHQHQHQHGTGKVNVPLQQAIEAILSDRPIAYHAVLARLVGSVTAGVLLSQLLYWMPRSKDQEGWFWKTQEEIYEETALTRSEQETARRLLRQALVLEEKRAGAPAKLYFRINMMRLTRLLTDYGQQPARAALPPPRGVPAPSATARTTAVPQTAGFPHSRVPDSRSLGGGFPAAKNGGSPPTNTETTTEITPQQQHSVAGQHATLTTAVRRERAVVVDLLIGKGMTPSTARVLAGKYPELRITEQIAVLEYLQKRSSPAVSRSPVGWLRRAIEEDWAPPEDYVQAKHAERRRAQRQEEAAREHEAQLLEQAEVHRRDPQERAAAMVRVQEETRQKVLKRPPTAPDDLAAQIASLAESYQQEAERFFAEYPELQPAQGGPDQPRSGPAAPLDGAKNGWLTANGTGAPPADLPPVSDPRFGGTATISPPPQPAGRQSNTIRV